MLVLYRKPKQEVIIKCKCCEVITIKLLGQNKFGDCKLGFNAPKEISINRAELKHNDENKTKVEGN